MADRKNAPSSARPSKLLKVLVLGGAVLATSCATPKGGDGAKPASSKPADPGPGGGVSGW
jgi:hypothetical protein